MKRKKIVLFSDYIIRSATHKQKEDCMTAARRAASRVVRGGTLFAQIRIQLGYVRPWFWMGILAVLTVMLSLFHEIIQPAVTPFDACLHTLMLFCTLGPALACLSAPVLVRSQAHDMWELEEAAFYNLPRLTALRLLICALAALPVIVILAVLGLGMTGAIQGLAALIVPFLLANGLNYLILGRLRGTAGSLCCIGAGSVLAMLCPAAMLWANMLPGLLQSSLASVTGVAAIAVCVLFCVWSARRYIGRAQQIIGN